MVGTGWVVLIGSVFTGIALGIARETGITSTHPFSPFNARVEELFVFLACTLVGVIVGGFFIVLGQMLHVVLDLRQVVIGIRRDLKHSSPRGDESGSEGRWVGLSDR
jgi:hypothetical protein